MARIQPPPGAKNRKPQPKPDTKPMSERIGEELSEDQRFWLIMAAAAVLLFILNFGACLAVVALLGLAIWQQYWKKRRPLELLREYWWWLIPAIAGVTALLTMLAFQFPTHSLFGEEENPTALYFDFAVDPENFPEDKRDLLKKWDPGDKKTPNKELQRTILDAANLAGIEAKEVLPFDPTKAGEQEDCYVLAFQSARPEGQEERLLISFREYKGGKKRIRMFSVPKDLKVRPNLFFRGFQQLTGAKVDIKFDLDWKDKVKKKEGEKKDEKPTAPKKKGDGKDVPI